MVFTIDIFTRKHCIKILTEKVSKNQGNKLQQSTTTIFKMATEKEESQLLYIADNVHITAQHRFDSGFSFWF